MIGLFHRRIFNKSVVRTLIISVILSLSLIFGASAISLETNDINSSDLVDSNQSNEGLTQGLEPDYKEVCSSGSAVMYANMDTGLFAVQNKETAKIWYSTPIDSKTDLKTKGVQRMNVRSQIVVNYIYRSDESISGSMTSVNSQAGAITAGTVNVEKLNDGIFVTYSFTDQSFVIPVEYRLKDNYITACIRLNELKEGNQCFIVSIQLLPSFGAGNSFDKGYLFVPDGSGALIYFNNSVNMSASYDKMVYGDELANVERLKKQSSETIRIPVFGTVIGNDALMGVITQGDGCASILALNGNDYNTYNCVSSKMNYRIVSEKTAYETDPRNTRQISKISKQTPEIKKYEVRYYLLSNESANYVGMAKQYRDYLIKEKGLKKKEWNPGINLNIYGCIDTKASFLGIPYTKSLPLTTFKQAEQMISDLNELGITNTAVRYIGWNNYGVMNKKIPDKAKPMSQLGGEKNLKELEEILSNKQMSFYPDADLIRFRSGGNGIRKSGDAIKNVFGEVSIQYEYLRSVFATKLDSIPIRLLSAKKIEKVSDRFLKSYESLNIQNIDLSTLGRFYYSDLDEKDGFNRADLIDKYLYVLEQYKKSQLNMCFESANAYIFPYADRIVNAPVYSSGYDFFDEDVPFYEMVLHGYIPLTLEPMVQSMNQQINYLKSIEYGCELLYNAIYEQANKLSDTQYDYLYSSTYTLWIQDAAKKYKEYQDVLTQIARSEILTWETVADQVIKTTYENGISIYLNYNSHDVKTDGKTINAMSFLAEGER